MPTVPNSTTTERSDLDRRLLGSVAWTAIARFGSQAITWVVTLIVARLLVPSDYGVVAAASAYLGLVRIVTEFGLGTAIVAQRNLSDRQIAQLGGMAAALGVGAWLLTLAGANVVASAMAVPQLRVVVPILGLGTALSALNALPTALLQRSLAFKTLSKIEFLRTISASATLLLMAWRGYGFWALIANEVVSAALAAVALYAATRYRLAVPHLTEIGSSLRVSWNVIVSRIAWFSYTNSDIAIVSRRLGAVALGDYSMSWTLTNVPSEKIGAVVMSVMPSVFARVQDNTAELVRYFLLLIEGLAIVLFPATIGIALVAPEFIPLLLGEKWRGAVPIVQIFGVLLSLRSISPVCAQVLVARGRSSVMMWHAVASASIMPIAFFVGSRWGVIGVASSWLCVSPFLTLALFWLTCRELQIPIRQLMLVLLRPAVSVCLMAGCVLVAKELLSRGSLAPSLVLVILVLVGAIVYTLAGLVLLKQRAQQVWRLVRSRS